MDDIDKAQLDWELMWVTNREHTKAIFAKVEKAHLPSGRETQCKLPDIPVVFTPQMFPEIRSREKLGSCFFFLHLLSKVRNYRTTGDFFFFF